MGVCESKKELQEQPVQAPPPQIIPQTQVEELPLKEIKYYTYRCPINLTSIPSLNDSQITHHQNKIRLVFVLSNIKIHQCFSRDKSNKKSLFIFEMQLGTKIFPLFCNYGLTPLTPDKCEEKIDLNSFNDLSNHYLKINIYEIISEFNEEKLKSFRTQPKLLKTYIPYSRHCNYFQMDLLSFLFRGNKFDFPLLGRKQISNYGRISFQLDIEQLCCYQIIIEDKDSNGNNEVKSEFVLNSKKFNSKVNYKDNKFFMNTIPLSMNDLASSDLYIQKTDPSKDEYEYYSLNELKAKLFKDLTNEILKNFSYLVFGNFEEQQSRSINIKNFFSDSKKKSNNKYTMTIKNLPIIVQARNLIFTEKGHKNNTSILYTIVEDQNVLSNYKNKCVLYDEIHPKFEKNMNSLRQNHKLDVTLYEIQELLKKTAEEDRLIYKYQCEEELLNIIMQLMELGVKLIKKLQKTDDQSKIVGILENLCLLLKREELNNEIILYYIKKFEPKGTNIQGLYNDYFLYLFKLNKIVKEKIKPGMYENLVDIYTSLYFRNAMVRESLLNSISLQVKDYENNAIDYFLYDIKNDELLNVYLSDSNKDTLNTNMIKTSQYFSNIVKEAYIPLIKNIWNYQYKQKIYAYPFDIMVFNDNQEIISTMANYIKEQGTINLPNEFFDSISYISSSYFALKRINSIMITSTNAYDSAACYLLIDYLQYIIDAYYKETNNFLIMDYNLIEKAITIIVNIENSLNLPKVFWLYYCDGHMMPTSNIKWLIKNVINKNFSRYIFSWSWKIRSLFVKLVLYTIYDRLKYVNGKYLNLDLLKKLMDKSDINVDTNYKEQGIKEFNALYEEYIQWKSAKQNNEFIDYPMIFLPLARNDDIA